MSSAVDFSNLVGILLVVIYWRLSLIISEVWLCLEVFRVRYWYFFLRSPHQPFGKSLERLVYVMWITRLWPSCLCYDWPFYCLVLFLFLIVVLFLAELSTIIRFWFKSWFMISTAILGGIMWCWNLIWLRLMTECLGLSLFRCCSVLGFQSGGSLWFSELPLALGSWCWWIVDIFSLREVLGRAIIFP